MSRINPQSTPAIIVVVLALVIALAGAWALVGGLNGKKSAGAEDKAMAAAEPVTDCFESREDYTTVDRTEAAVPQYGYPNVKCSKTTKAVLWYGDPFDGTIPMGDMPDIQDDTHGDFANAYVKPRESHLTYFNMGPEGCKTCHDGNTVPVPKSKAPRQIEMHQDIVEDSTHLQHGRGALWCLDCHSAGDRNKLVDHLGNEISFNQPQKLCGSCHGEVYIDWRAGIHGKRTGTWATGGKKRWWVCTECHNPHTVQVNRFNPLMPEPPPPLPRGMLNANHERVREGAH